MTKSTAPSVSWHRIERLRIRHLRLLELIHQLGSLSAAALEMGMAQPAVTLMLREFEDALGTTLVERDARGARLTASGLNAVERFAIASTSIELAVEAATTPEALPALRIGMIALAGLDLLPRLARAMQERDFPYRMSIREAPIHVLVDELLRGDLDGFFGRIDATIAQDIRLEELDVMHLIESHFVVVAATDHPLARRSKLPLRSLATEKWILPAKDTQTRKTIDQVFIDAGLPAPQPAIESGSFHTNVLVVARTRMLTVMPLAALEAYGQLVRVLSDKTLRIPNRSMSFISHRHYSKLSGVANLRAVLGELFDLKRPG